MRTLGRFALTAFALSLVFVLTGVIPRNRLQGGPTHVYLAPEVEGRLSEAGWPIAHTEVRLIGWGRAVYSGFTDAQGRFHVGPVGAYTPNDMNYIYSASDPVYCYEIEFRIAGRAPVRFGFTGMGYPEPERNWRFDLTAMEERAKKMGVRALKQPTCEW